MLNLPSTVVNSVILNYPHMHGYKNSSREEYVSLVFACLCACKHALVNL